VKSEETGNNWCWKKRLRTEREMGKEEIKQERNEEGRAGKLE